LNEPDSSEFHTAPQETQEQQFFDDGKQVFQKDVPQSPQYFEFEEEMINAPHSSAIDFQHDLDSGEYYGMFLKYTFKFYLKDLFFRIG
jgi:hypothetical protein